MSHKPKIPEDFPRRLWALERASIHMKKFAAASAEVGDALHELAFQAGKLIHGNEDAERMALAAKSTLSLMAAWSALAGDEAFPRDLRLGASLFDPPAPSPPG